MHKLITVDRFMSNKISKIVKLCPPGICTRYLHQVFAPGICILLLCSILPASIALGALDTETSRHVRPVENWQYLKRRAMLGAKADNPFFHNQDVKALDYVMDLVENDLPLGDEYAELPGLIKENEALKAKSPYQRISVGLTKLEDDFGRKKEYLIWYVALEAYALYGSDLSAAKRTLEEERLKNVKISFKDSSLCFLGYLEGSLETLTIRDLKSVSLLEKDQSGGEKIFKIGDKLLNEEDDSRLLKEFGIQHESTIEVSYEVPDTEIPVFSIPDQPVPSSAPSRSTLIFVVSVFVIIATMAVVGYAYKSVARPNTMQKVSKGEGSASLNTYFSNPPFSS